MYTWTCTWATKELRKEFAQKLQQELKAVISECFPEFGIIFDGTPSFAEAEAVKIRLVRKDFVVIELLIKLSCFKRKLNSNNIVNHLIDTIEGELFFRLDHLNKIVRRQILTRWSRFIRIMEMTVVRTHLVMPGRKWWKVKMHQNTEVYS